MKEIMEVLQLHEWSTGWQTSYQTSDSNRCIAGGWRAIIVDKVSRTSKESDEMYVKLEEKRMKLEERMIEMEFEWLREDKAREERKRREEREFQLRMMMMMSQQGGMGSLSAQFTPAYIYSAHNCSSSSGSNNPQWPDSEL